MIIENIKTILKRFDFYYNNKIINMLRSFKLSTTKKNLESCAKDFSRMLSPCNWPQNSLRNKICLEIGSGFVLSHAVICYLLGAEKVIATDVKAIAHARCLKYAIKHSNYSRMMELLSPYVDIEEVEKRYKILKSLKKFNEQELKKINIEYVAPIDIAQRKLSQTVDFIYSFAVLEHVPVDRVNSLIDNLVHMLNANGTMIHMIHLEDHRDFSKPFEFYAEKHYPEDMQSKRGNRLRPSHYERILKQIDGIEYKVVTQLNKKNVKLPPRIYIDYTDENDLRARTLGLYITRI